MFFLFTFTYILFLFYLFISYVLGCLFDLTFLWLAVSYYVFKLLKFYANLYLKNSTVNIPSASKHLHANK